LKMLHKQLNKLMKPIDFLKEKLSAKKFEQLHSYLGISINRATRIKNNPELMNSEEIKRLGKIINPDAPQDGASDLIGAGCGKKVLTVYECELLTKCSLK